MPIILTASGVGAQLAALVRSTAMLQAGSGSGAESAAEAWAALECLPHAAENAAQAAACCEALAAATAPAEVEEAQGHDAAGTSSPLLMLHCCSLGAQAEMLASSGAEGGSRVVQQLLPQALALLARRPRCYHAVAAAAAVLQQAFAAGAELSQQQLQELVPLLAPNLSASSQPLRRETLRALCCFPMPHMLAAAGSGDTCSLSHCLLADLLLCGGILPATVSTLLSSPHRHRIYLWCLGAHLPCLSSHVVLQRMAPKGYHSLPAMPWSSCWL